MDETGDIVQGTDRHAARVKTLAPDTPVFDEDDLPACCGKADGREPSCRAPAKDDDHDRIPDRSRGGAVVFRRIQAGG
jgi:hypothetical protein